MTARLGILAGLGEDVLAGATVAIALIVVTGLGSVERRGLDLSDGDQGPE